MTGATERLRVVVSGLIAQYPLGGVAWDYVQYAAGLARLGHDVTYVEDTGLWPYNPDEGGVSETCDANVRHLGDVMRRFGLDGRWAYRFPWGPRWFGLSEDAVRRAVRDADLVVNVSGTLASPEQYRPARGRLVYIDSDPGFTQAKLLRGQQDFRSVVDAHDVHFTFGETLASSPLPATGHRWRATRQPVLLSEWDGDFEDVRRDVFTTVMNWTSYKPIEVGDLRLGQKDEELTRFLELPAAVSPERLELAVAAGKTRRTPRSLLARRGWSLVDPDAVCGSLDDYRRYLAASTAECSVAKGGYVAARTGWFSCRSACYLAAGRPVVVQETGFSSVIPSGEGVVAFSTFPEAVEAVREVSARYRRHARAARELAAAYFDSDRVPTALVDEAAGRV